MKKRGCRIKKGKGKEKEKKEKKYKKANIIYIVCI